MIRSALFLAVLPSVGWSATLTVPGDQPTIQDAVDAAATGDTILVSAGTWQEEVSIVGKDLTLTGVGGSSAVRVEEARTFTIDSATVTLTGFEVVPDERGFDIIDATVILEDVHVHGTGADLDGGGLRARASSVTILDARFDDNQADPSDGGHIWAEDSTLSVTDTTLTNAQAGDGAGIFATGNTTLTLLRTTLEGNDADGSGGGIFLDPGVEATITDSTFRDNRSGDGGGFFAEFATMNLTRTTFNDNRLRGGSNGAAGYALGTDITSVSTHILNHDIPSGAPGVVLTGQATWDGAGDVGSNNLTDNARGAVLQIRNGASATLVGAMFTDNAADDGGAIFHDSTGGLSIADSTFTGNTARGDGGAVFWNGGILSLSNSSFTDNDADGDGGGAFLSGQSASLTGNDFAGNVADAGGGTFLEVNNALATWNVWCGNRGRQDGGGVEVANTNAFAGGNNVLAENTTDGQGGGIRFVGGSSPTLRNNTFVGNGANSGGAAYFDGVGAAFVNNVVAAQARGNGLAADGNAANRTWTFQYDLWNANSTAHFGGGLSNTVLDNSHVLAAPDLMWSIGGCGVSTYKPFPGSPVIDAGDPSILDPDTSPSDIGAFGGPSVDGDLYLDLDNDGFIGLHDCNDDDPSIKPGATESCDNVDNDCDGTLNDPESVDATSFWADLDFDGFGDPSATVMACFVGAGVSDNHIDCDDADPDIGGPETWLEDGDGDGWGNDLSTLVACLQPQGYVDRGEDCDDTDATIHPDADETCNGLDDDCDSAIDENAIDAVSWYGDTDRDGYGDSQDLAVACTAPAGFVDQPGDCDDTNALVNPGEPERCNGIDDDCDTVTDEADAVDATTWYLDTDADGWGGTTTLVTCYAPTGYVDLGGDCNDADAVYHPFAPETCASGLDTNCDGFTGNVDNDGDGTIACDDCDDGDRTIHPGATEYCDDADNDCDGIVDEADAADAVLSFRDQDSDGYGDANQSVVACGLPLGYVDNGDDCNDTDSLVNPGSADVCGIGIDYNCDGAVGTGDADGDGAIACQDCDDTDDTRFPGADELCDAIDNDCDALIDEDGDVFGRSWFLDADQDGFGDPATEARSCDQPAGRIRNGTDCDDSDPASNPDADEVWYDGTDQDCDGASDYDQDQDGYDRARDGGGDCDDVDPDIHPDAREILDDGIDQNCDGEDAITPVDSDPDPSGPEKKDLEAKKGGCGCTTTPSPLSTGALILMLGLVATRRRSA